MSTFQIRIESLEAKIRKLLSGNAGGLDTTAGDARYLRKNNSGAAIQSVAAPNTNTGYGQASSQVSIGSTAATVDGGIGFAKGAVLVIKQNSTASGSNPMWLHMHTPDSTTANGILFFGFGGAGKQYPKIMTHSNFGDTNNSDFGLVIQTQIAEKAGMSDVTGLEVNVLSFYDANPTAYANGQNAFYAGGTRVPLSLSTSWLFRVKNWTNGNMGGVRAFGDWHLPGMIYTGTLEVADNFTMNLGVNTYLYTGPASKTVTFPAGEEGMSLTIINHGTGDLALSDNVYYQGTLYMSLLSFEAPDNVLHAQYISGKWRKKN